MIMKEIYPHNGSISGGFPWSRRDEAIVLSTSGSQATIQWISPYSDYKSNDGIYTYPKKDLLVVRKK